MKSGSCIKWQSKFRSRERLMKLNAPMQSKQANFIDNMYIFTIRIIDVRSVAVSCKEFNPMLKG